jgi:hypothetical protein
MRRCAAWLFLMLLMTPAYAASDLAGTWFGTGQPDDRSSMYIDRLRANGDWRGEYRTCVKGKSLDSIQTGHWSLSGDTLSLSVETVDGMIVSRTDIYRMLSHDAKAQKYVSLPSNFAYAPKRMPDSFKMPGCDLVS